MPETLRLAIIADIHHGPDKLTKVGSAALPLLRDFKAFAESYQPHFIAELGDRISDIDLQTDRSLLQEIADAFTDIPSPHRHLMGNHDQIHLSIAENGKILGQDMGHHSVDIAGRHLVFWQMDCEIHRPQGFLPNADDLKWLAADLAATNLPSIIFSHVPLDGGSLNSNFYFDNNERFGGLPHAREIQPLIRQAGNVILCVAGHVHWNDVNLIDGIPYITVQSLSESFTTEGMAAGAWASIEVDHEIRWRTHGRDEISLSLPVRSLNAHWRQPLPSFETLMRQQGMPQNLDNIAGLILDMDGVLYHGGVAVPGAAAAVANLQGAGIEIVALTNNARASAQDYSSKLAALGIELAAERIVTAGQATAQYLAAQTEAPGVFIAGSAALAEELRAAGAVESEQPAFVVAGFDMDMPLSRLSEAVGHLHRGARLIASNPDKVLPGESGVEAEAGAVVAFLEAASGQTAYVAGKPNSAIFALALQRLGLAADTVAVVGDTADTDIAGATAAGLRSIQVGSGNPVDPGSPHQPTAHMTDLA
ncbi:MAG: HAD-IIA family hydrolase, partial [Alphaproteobacteria bacterium]|nr:HAD-IIA family hydrolase [Alphaproteobacteria bacterium]